MYAMTGKLTARFGQRAVLASILRRAADLVGGMPGCRMYIVSEDAADEAVVHVYEMWDDKAAHDASLANEDVRTLIGQARPILAGPPEGAELRVIGGHGMP